MYLEHFGLREFPFSITPDTAFAFRSRAQQRALSALLVAFQLGEGFVKVVGEVGTGKTLLCRRLLARLKGRVVFMVPIWQYFSLLTIITVKGEWERHHTPRRCVGKASAAEIPARAG